jgi:hypothetical protein
VTASFSMASEARVEPKKKQEGGQKKSAAPKKEGA